MFITGIKKEKKHLVRIMLSDGAEVFLDSDIPSEESLSEGKDISEEELKALLEESDYRRAKSRALWYLDRTDHTEKGLYEKLVRAGFGKKASARVIAKLCELGLLDDRRYAERMAERCAEANVSKRQTVSKLLLKGIPLELAKEVTDGLDTDGVEQITALIERKYQNKLYEEGGRQKVFAALARKGFSFEDIKTALKKYDQELEFSEE